MPCKRSIQKAEAQQAETANNVLAAFVDTMEDSAAQAEKHEIDTIMEEITKNPKMRRGLFGMLKVNIFYNWICCAASIFNRFLLGLVPSPTSEGFWQVFQMCCFLGKDNIA